MTRATWRDPVSAAEVCRRAGGRRRLNAERRHAAFRRRCAILKLWGDGFDILAHGAKAQLAELLGVSAATITRDVQLILRPDWPGGWEPPDGLPASYARRDRTMKRILEEFRRNLVG